ncbi:MAG: DUF3450 family protein [Myxococcota bacterium]
MSKRPRLTRRALWVAAGLLVATPVVADAAGVTAADLAALRAEVDTLAADVETERTAARDEIAALRAERAELERQVRAARARTKTLERLRSEATARADAADEDARRWAAPTKAAIAEARAYVERGLPFASAQRLAVLDRLDKDLAAATPDYGLIVERLLRFVEEEEAMTGEVAYAKQRIELSGTPQIAEVLRLGLALMYVRTEDGTVAWAVRADGGWALRVVDDPALADVLRTRFDAAADNRALGPARILLPADGTFEGAAG